MKTWYHAVCDKHKSHCEIFVTNPLCTYAYLKDESPDIQAWLELHYGCNLRLIHHECDLEPILGVYESTDPFWNDMRIKKEKMMNEISKNIL